MEEKQQSPSNDQSGEELLITRIFDAPRGVVFKAWTEPERLAQWWGPKGFQWSAGTMQLRPGGMFHYCLQAPNGAEMWGKFIYREIVEPERLVFVVSFSDKEGNILRHPLSQSWPLEVLNTLVFTEQEGKTLLTMRGIPVNATDEERATFKAGHQGMQQGFKGTLDQLDQYLAKQ